jgi:hypothetical protein
MATGDVRRGTPELIAVSSFGEGLPPGYPPHRPGGGAINPNALPLAAR